MRSGMAVIATMIAIWIWIIQGIIDFLFVWD